MMMGRVGPRLRQREVGRRSATGLTWAVFASAKPVGSSLELGMFGVYREIPALSPNYCCRKPFRYTKV